MVVALGAADRQAEKDRPRGIDPVDDRVDPELLDVDPPFLVDLRVAMKPGGDPRGERGSGLQVAGDLIDGESVERHVGIERGDDPVAELPDRARSVDIVAVGIGVPSLVEPGARPPFAEMGRSQQAIDGTFISICRPIGQKGVDLTGRGRQTDQVETRPAQQCRTIGFRRGSQPAPIEPSLDKAVDRIASPAWIRDVGDGGPYWVE